MGTRQVQQITLRSYHARPPRPDPDASLKIAASIQPATNAEAERLGPSPRGPGIETIIEEIAAGSSSRDLRYYNTAVTPLVRAHRKGKITDAQFAAGEELRGWVQIWEGTGKDSTDLERISGTGQATPWTDQQRDAAWALKKVRDRLSRADYAICRKFCGEGFEMIEALRLAGIPFHPNGVTARVCEALDALARR